MLRKIVGFGLAAFLVAAPVQADHTAYYTYYKLQKGDTLLSVAAEHGVAPNAIEAMNPALTQGGKLEDMTFICVPNRTQPPEPAEQESPEVEPASTPAPKKVAKKPSSTKEEVTEDELSYLEEYATSKVSRCGARRVAVSHVNKVISSDGRVTYIPSARPAPKPEPQDHRRTKLSSRQGKRIHGVLKTCRRYMGVPYVWGGESPGGFDCSGYVQYVFGKHGVHLPRTADIQFNVGRRVKRGQERPGDLVFFETYAPGASHVGVYLGNRLFIHASSSHQQVAIGSLNDEYFSARYLGARRNL